MKKLIRYDLAWMAKLPAYYAALALLFTGLSRATEPLVQSTVGNLIHGICFGAAVSMAVSTVVNTLIRCWIRVLRYSYKDESYLYHTLPVKRSTLYWAHILASFAAVLLATLFCALCIFLLLVGKEAMTWLKDFLSQGTGLASFLLIALCAILEMLFLLLCGTTGTVLGYSRDGGGRTLRSVLFALAIYFAAGMVNLGLIYAVGLADPAMGSLFEANALPDPDGLWKLGVVADGAYLVFVLVLAGIGSALYRKKINVD